MKYFITGATGFIGGRVARQLREQGHDVIALARSPSKAQHLADAGVTLVAGDITDKDCLRAPMEGVDGVFHIAGWYQLGGRDKSDGQKINVVGTQHVLEVMKELRIPRGVYTSTLAVFSDTKGQVPDETYRYTGKRHITEYDRTKWVAHYEVAEPMVQDGLPLITVQPGLVYGPGDTSPIHDTLVQYLQRKLPVVPYKSAYSWAHVDDVARAHLLAMDKGTPGETYIIGGPIHTMIEAMSIAEKITGVPAPRRVSPRLLKIGAAITGVLNRFLPLPELYDPEVLRASAGVSYLGNNARAKRELGYAPRPLEEGLRETLQWEMKQLGMKS